jgi:hypothetical protein
VHGALSKTVGAGGHASIEEGPTQGDNLKSRRDETAKS